MTAIEPKLTEKFHQDFLNNNKQNALQCSVVESGINVSDEFIQGVVNNVPVFSVDSVTGKVANQKQGGRCWMFAALSTFRHRVLDAFQLKDFELSRNCTFFWDKYEKSNYFYESIIAATDQPLTSREVALLLATPQQDDEQQDMIVSIFGKYSVVPKTAMLKGSSGSSSRDLNNYLSKKLRKDATILCSLTEKGASAEEVQKNKEIMLQEIYNFLAISLEAPPEALDFEYRDEEENCHLDQNLTPRTFFERYVGVNLYDYMSIINTPTENKPFNKTYTVGILGNTVGDREVKYLNVEMAVFKKLVAAQLEQDESVWFSCDVGQSPARDTGIVALDVYDMNNLFSIGSITTKAGRLDFGESLMTHAVVLTGVDIADGRAIKWKVENGWGEKVDKDGFFVMSDAWMDECVYQIVMHKDLLTDEQGKAWEQAPTVLAPQGPMGALA